MSRTRLISLIGASDDEKEWDVSPARTPPGSAVGSELFCSSKASAQSAMPSSSAGFSSTAITLSLPVEVITPQTFVNANCIFCVVRPILALKHRYAFYRHLNACGTIKFNKVPGLH